MKAWIVGLLLLLTGLQCELWFAQGGLPSLKELKASVETQAARNALLAKRNLALEEEVMELKMGQQALEERARDELNMVSAGENFYQVVDESKSSLK